MLLLIHSVEFWVTRIDRNWCWSWHASKINLIFLHLYLIHFPLYVSIDSFLLGADCSFLKIMKLVFYVGLGVLIDQMRQNFFSVELSWYSTSNFAKTTFLISSINFRIDDDIFLNASSMKQLLTSSLRLECW